MEDKICVHKESTCETGDSLWFKKKKKRKLLSSLTGLAFSVLSPFISSFPPCPWSFSSLPQRFSDARLDSWFSIHSHGSYITLFPTIPPILSSWWSLTSKSYLAIIAFDFAHFPLFWCLRLIRSWKERSEWDPYHFLGEAGSRGRTRGSLTIILAFSSFSSSSSAALGWTFRSSSNSFRAFLAFSFFRTLWYLQGSERGTGKDI